MDQLDNLFKGKLEDRQISFDEAYWQAAEKMLDEKEKKRRRGILWWLLSACVLAGGALILLVIWPKTLTQEKALPSATIDQASIIDNSETNKAEVVDQLRLNDQKIEAKEKIKQAETIIVKEPIAKAKRHTLESTQLLKPQTNEGTLPFESLQATIPKEIEKKQINNPTILIEEEIIVNDAAADVGENDGRSVVAILPTISQLAFEVAYPKASLDINKMPTDISKTPITNPWQYYTLASVMLNPNDGKQVLGGRLGVGGRYNFKKGSFVYADMAYRLISGTFGIAQESQVQRFGFGLSQENFQLKPSQLHYISSNIGIGKRWQRHQAYAGLSYQYLLGIKGTLASSTKTDFSLDFSAAQTIEEGWLDEKGYRKNLIGGVLGYQFALSKKLNLGLELEYWPGGLLDDTIEIPEASRLKENGPVFIDFGMYYQL